MADPGTSHEDYLETLRREAEAGNIWAQEALEFWTSFNADRRRRRQEAD